MTLRAEIEAYWTGDLRRTMTHASIVGAKLALEAAKGKRYELVYTGGVYSEHRDMKRDDATGEWVDVADIDALLKELEDGE